MTGIVTGELLTGRKYFFIRGLPDTEVSPVSPGAGRSALTEEPVTVGESPRRPDPVC
jgi:hypothetical protein